MVQADDVKVIEVNFFPIKNLVDKAINLTAIKKPKTWTMIPEVYFPENINKMVILVNMVNETVN